MERGWASVMLKRFTNDYVSIFTLLQYLDGVKKDNMKPGPVVMWGDSFWSACEFASWLRTQDNL